MFLNDLGFSGLPNVECPNARLPIPQKPRHFPALGQANGTFLYTTLQENIQITVRAPIVLPSMQIMVYHLRTTIDLLFFKSSYRNPFSHTGTKH